MRKSSARPRRFLNRRGARWLHGDYKDAPYSLVFKLYDKFVDIDGGHSK